MRILLGFRDWLRHSILTSFYKQRVNRRQWDKCQCVKSISEPRWLINIKFNWFSFKFSNQIFDALVWCWFPECVIRKLLYQTFRLLEHFCGCIFSVTRLRSDRDFYIVIFFFDFHRCFWCGSSLHLDLSKPRHDLLHVHRKSIIVVRFAFCEFRLRSWIASKVELIIFVAEF